MLNKRTLRCFSGLIPATAFFLVVAGTASAAGVSNAASRQAGERQATPKQRTSPIYATSRQGAPVVNLTAADLEVKLAGNPVSDFTLTKGGSKDKLLFLVFDTASLGSNALSVSKEIAQSTIARAGEGVRFVVMSVDPGAGLKLICGPTTEREAAGAAISRSIASKFWSHDLDSSGINRVAAPDPARIQKEDREIGPIVIGSLRTLGAVVGRFTESDKVVQFYSGGIPQGAMVQRSTIPQYIGYTNAWVPESFTSPETDTYYRIMSCGQGIKKSGALLFAINAAGVVTGEAHDISGEPSLRMLVSESGGRYFEGTQKAVSDSLAEIEEGYYELGVPLAGEVGDAGVSLEVRPKSPDITVTSASTFLKTRSFGKMTPAEKQVTIMALVSHGLAGDIGLKVSKAPVEISGNGEASQLSVQLPVELSQAEWDIYKVWRDTSKGTFQIEKEHVLSESPLLTFSVAGRKDTIQDAVLVQAQSGTVLVCQGKGKPKS